MSLRLSTGKPEPLGAKWDGKGTNFALYSENATSVILCLFDHKNKETQLPLVEKENHVWYGYLKGIKPGQLYNFRVNGAYEPHNGHHFNVNKLLIDPYAKAIAGDVKYGQELFNYDLKDKGKKVSISCLSLDNAHLIPKAVVINDDFNWEGDQLLNRPWHAKVLNVRKKG